MDKIRIELEKKIKYYILILAMIGCSMSGIRIFFILNIFPEAKGEDFITGAMDGFFIGFNVGLLLFISMAIIKIKKSLKDERRMKKYYTFINDERNVLIKTKSAIPLNIVNSYLIVLAAYVLQGINVYISLTCVAIAIFLIIQLIVLKLYYMKTM